MAEEKQKQQMQQFPEDDEPPFSGGYLTREMLENPPKLTPEEQKALDEWKERRTKKLAEAGVLKPRTGGNTPSKR